MKPGKDYIGVCIAFFCHDGAGNLLFQKRSAKCRDEQGTWDCGGGKLEHGETIETGIARELMEEYGCTGVIDEVLQPTTYLRHDENETHHWVILPHVVRVDRSAVRINEPDKVDEIGWFTLATLPAPLHSGTAKDIAFHRGALKKYSN